jgi:malate dehydrogenase
MAKVTIIGSGNVGATCANVLAHKDIVKEIVLLDIQGKMAQGKALDTWQQAPIDSYSTALTGTDDYVGSVIENITKYSPNPIIIVVSNPLDVMTYAAYKKAGLHKSRVIGMAGVLDTARYRAFLATELGVSPKDIQAILMGGHGDTMVPLPRYTTVSGIPVTELIDADKLDAIIARTKDGGGELVRLMGTSAWYAPGAAAAQMVEAIVKDEKRIFPCCAYLEGEYGINDLCVGVPTKLGKNGIEQIIELKLNDEEKALLVESAKAVKEIVDAYEAMNL